MPRGSPQESPTRHPHTAPHTAPTHAPARHTVELDITDDAGGTATPFYLMSLIVS